MRDKLRKNLASTTANAGLALITLLFGFLCGLFSELAFPLYAASLAALFLYDKNSKRILSVSLPIVVVVVNILVGSLVPAAAIFAPFVSLVLYLMYKNGMSKGECAGYMTVICTVMLVVGAFAIAMLSVKQFSIPGALEYFDGLYNNVADEIVKFIDEAVNANPGMALPADFSEETVMLLLSSLVMFIPSFAVWIAFLLVGLTCKIFGFIVSRLSDKPEYIVSWRFSTNSIFAYFYLAVTILSGLAGAADVFGIAIANIQNVFMVIYGYIGFNYAQYLFSRNRSSFFVTLMLIVAIVALSSIAISILSFLGVYFTVMKNKLESGSINN